MAMVVRVAERLTSIECIWLTYAHSEQRHHNHGCSYQPRNTEAQSRNSTGCCGCGLEYLRSEAAFTYSSLPRKEPWLSIVTALASEKTSDKETAGKARIHESLGNGIISALIR